MPGEIKRSIDSIIDKRAQGNPTLAAITKTKLVLKGINVDSYTSTSEDDPAILQKVQQAASELGVTI